MGVVPPFFKQVFFLKSRHERIDRGTKEDVDRLTQARLYEAGVLTVKQFAVLCEDVEEMRETAVKELALEMNTLKDKAKLSKMLVAFEIAKYRSSRMAELEGEAAVEELPKSFANPRFLEHEGGLREKVLDD